MRGLRHALSACVASCGGSARDMGRRTRLLHPTENHLKDDVKVHRMTRLVCAVCHAAVYYRRGGSASMALFGHYQKAGHLYG